MRNKKLRFEKTGGITNTFAILICYKEVMSYIILENANSKAKDKLKGSLKPYGKLINDENNKEK